jgi:PTS system N-acetylgalactosamine-specific IIA component
MKSSADEGLPESSQQPRAIIAGHGDFPEGMVSAVQQISGRGSVFLALSNRGLSGEDIEARLKAAAEETGAKVFFTDLPAGSATLAIRRMMRGDPGVVLVTGANLATLLEFVFQSDSDSAGAAQQSVEKGRASMSAYGPR